MELDIPHEAATGHASGKRQYQPITVTKEWGAASPQILQAAATNETLSTVSLRFVHTTSTGVEETSQTITLTNATISEVRRYVDFTAAAGMCWPAGTGGRVISVPGEGDPDADSLRQPVDFYSPDTSLAPPRCSSWYAVVQLKISV